MIRDLEYEPSASIRGLHYDIEKGLLLKIDSINQIQFGTVYRGREKLENDEVLQIYKRRRLPQDYVDAHLKPGVRHAHHALFDHDRAHPIPPILTG